MAAVVLLQFAWAAIAMAFVLVGVTSPGATPPLRYTRSSVVGRSS